MNPTPSSSGVREQLGLAWPLLLLSAIYTILVGAGCALILWRNAPTHNQAVNTEGQKKMTDSNIDWQIQVNSAAVPAKPTGLWTLVYEYVRGPALISFNTDPTTKWRYASKSESTADGDQASMISAQACILPGAPVGALIGKIGGSSAGQADGKVFLVGAFAIIEVDASTRGPLYLTINDETSGLENNTGSLDVSIRVKSLQTASQAPTPPTPPPGSPPKT